VVVSILLWSCRSLVSFCAISALIDWGYQSLGNKLRHIKIQFKPMMGDVLLYFKETKYEQLEAWLCLPNSYVLRRRARETLASFSLSKKELERSFLSSCRRDRKSNLCPPISWVGETGR
jgi:hypothetical protein